MQFVCICGVFVLNVVKTAIMVITTDVWHMVYNNLLHDHHQSLPQMTGIIIAPKCWSSRHELMWRIPHMLIYHNIKWQRYFELLYVRVKSLQPLTNENVGIKSYILHYCGLHKSSNGMSSTLATSRLSWCVAFVMSWTEQQFSLIIVWLFGTVGRCTILINAM